MGRVGLVGSNTLSHYTLLERLGTGPLGEIHRARDTRLGRTVSIRILPPALTTDPATRERFLADAQAAAALSHPNVAAIYEVGDDQGLVFLAGEFVPGESLRTVMGGQPMNPRRAVELAAQLADGVADAHALGLVHGHITQDDVVVTPRGNAKLMDVGLARWSRGAADRPAAQPRDDVAALGRLLAEMVKGAGKKSGRQSATELDEVIAKTSAGAGEPGYQSAATFAAELRSVAAILDVRSGDAEPIAITPPSNWGWAREAVLGLVVIGLLGWLASGPVVRLWRSFMSPPPAPIVAMLPLALETADQDELFFADGLTDDIARRLSRIPGLTVVGRSGARGDRGRSPADVAREIGAAVVMTGRVRSQSSPMSVSLALVNPEDGAEIWTGEFSRVPAEIFALQAEAADAVADALGLVVPPTAARARAAARVVDATAYRAYLRGRRAEGDGRLAEASAWFQQAADVDPGLVEALAALALSLDAQRAEGMPIDAARRDQAAARAYQLDPDLPEANAAMAAATADLPRALAYLKHGVEVDRSWADGYRRIADRIREFDPVRSAAFYRASLAVDPRLEAGRAGLAAAQNLPVPPSETTTREEIKTVLDGVVP